MTGYKTLHGPLWVVIYPWTYEPDQIVHLFSAINPINAVRNPACKGEQN